MASKGSSRSKGRRRKKQSKTKKLARRLTILATVLLLGMSAAIGAWWWRKNPAPEKLMKRAQEELAAGNVKAASENLRLVERQENVPESAKALRVEVLRAEAEQLLAVDATGTQEGNDGRKVSMKAIGKLVEAMQVHGGQLAGNGPDEKWEELLAFEEARLLTGGSGELASRAQKMAEKRLLAVPEDKGARRLLMLAQVFEATIDDVAQPQTQRLRDWENDLAVLDQPDLFLRLVRRLVGLSAASTGTDRQDLAKWAVGYPDSRLTVNPADSRWRFCRVWASAVTGPPESALAEVDALRESLLASVEFADWKWLQAACMAMLEFDRRPTWELGRLTTMGTSAVQAVLDRKYSFAERPAYRLLRAQVMPPDQAVGQYQSLIKAEYDSNDSANIWQAWACAQIAQQAIPGTLVEAAMSDRRGPWLESAQAAVDNLDDGPYKNVLQAYLLMAAGNWHLAVERFAKAEEQGVGMLATLGRAEALLAAGESGAGLQLALQVSSKAAGRLPSRAATRTQILVALTLLRLRQLDLAERVVEGMAVHLTGMPAVDSLGREIQFSKSLQVLAQSRSTDQFLGNTGDRRVAQMRDLIGALRAGETQTAASLLKGMPLSWGTGAAWQKVLAREPKLTDSYLEEWRAQLQRLPESLMKRLLTEWVEAGKIAPLLRADRLLTTQGIDPGRADVQIVDLAWSMGMGESLPSDWREQLPDRLDAWLLRYKAASAIGDVAAADAAVAAIEERGQSRYYGDLMRAERRLRSGQLREAETVVQGVIEAWPQHSGARLLMGLIKKRSGDREGALESLKQALAIRPDLKPAMREAFGLLYQDGQKDDAMRLMASYQRLYPGEAELLRLLGEIGQDGDSVKLRAQVQERIVASDPYNDGNRLGLAALYERSGQIEKARALAEKLVAEEPEGIQARCWLASFLVRQGNKQDGRRLIDDAITGGKVKTSGDWLAIAGVFNSMDEKPAMNKALQEALKLDNPKTLQATRAVAQTLFQLGRYGESLALLERVWKLQPVAVVGGLSAECAYRLGKIDVFTAWIDRIAGVEPEWPGLPRLRATLALHEGDEDAALALLTKAIEAAPNDPNNYVARARLQHRKNKRQEAIADYRAALVRAPGNATARLELGSLMLAEGNFEDGLEIMEGGEPIIGTHPAYRVRQAAILFQAKRFGEAKTILDGLHEEFGNDLVVLQALAQLSQAIGDPRLAAKYSRALLEMSPKKTFVQRNNLAFWLAAVGDVAEARKLIEEVRVDLRSLKLPPMVMAQLIDTRGFVELASGNFSAAQKEFQEAMSMGDWPGLRINYAWALTLAGDTQAAYSMLQPLLPQLDGEADGKPALADGEKLQFLEVLAASGGAREAAQHCGKLLIGDSPIVARPEWHARVLAAMATAQQASGLAVQARVSALESLEIAETAEGHLAMAIAAGPGSDRAASLGKARQVLVESPDALLSLRVAAVRR